MKIDISKLDLEQLDGDSFERAKSKSKIKKFSGKTERNRKELNWIKARRHHSRNRGDSDRRNLLRSWVKLVPRLQ